MGLSRSQLNTARVALRRGIRQRSCFNFPDEVVAEFPPGGACSVACGDGCGCIAPPLVWWDRISLRALANRRLSVG